MSQIFNGGEYYEFFKEKYPNHKDKAGLSYKFLMEHVEKFQVVYYSQRQEMPSVEVIKFAIEKYGLVEKSIALAERELYSYEKDLLIVLRDLSNQKKSFGTQFSASLAAQVAFFILLALIFLLTAVFDSDLGKQILEFIGKFT
ncbi:MAG: hypothetical protein R8G66_26050 [Cytophagales bacterium]|nr:hypothetical protein [Cytophagales bacterium]